MSPLHFFKLKCRSTIQASSGRIQSDVSVAPKLLERNVSQNCGVEGDPHNFFYDDHPSVANGSLDFNELQGEQDQSSISPFASALNKMERLEGTLRYVLPRCARYQNEAIFDKYYDGIEDNSEDNVSTTDSIINCISSQDKLSNVPEIGGESIEGCMKQKTLEQTINEIVTLAKELPNLAKETSLADWGLDEIVCFQAMTEWELIPQFIRGDMKKIAALNFIRCPVDCLGCSKEFIGSDCEFTCFGWKIVHLERWLEEDVSEKELSFWWIGVLIRLYSSAIMKVKSFPKMKYVVRFRCTATQAR